MRKLRVIHILNSSSYSGAENVVITFIKSTNSKIDHTYVSLDGDIRDVLKENNIDFYPVKSLSVINIIKCVISLQPDIIHAHDFTAGVITSLLPFNIPIINHLHNNSPWLKTFSINSVIYGFSAFRFNKILTVSDSVMNEYIFGNLFTKKTTVVGNPISIKNIIYKSESATINNKSDIIFLGRLSRQKNPFLFIDIIYELTRKIPDLTVAMVGEGELHTEVERKIKEKKMENVIKLYGFQKNPYGLLKYSKVMCMPSLWEGFGLAAVESLALGKPVVASPVGGLDKIINDSCGLKCSNKQEYIDELFRLLSDNEYYHKKTCGALSRSQDFDNIKKYRKDIIKIYKDVLRR